MEVGGDATATIASASVAANGTVMEAEAARLIH
jgi:hypothetical protein